MVERVDEVVDAPEDCRLFASVLAPCYGDHTIVQTSPELASALCVEPRGVVLVTKPAPLTQPARAGGRCRGGSLRS